MLQVLIGFFRGALLGGFLLVLSGCSNFVFSLRQSDHLLVLESGVNSVEVFGVNSSTGALSLQTTLSLTSPQLVVSHPSESTFFIALASGTLNCYRYDPRRGTGPTLESSTSLGVLSAMEIPRDGGAIVYGKSANGTVFWRSLSYCSLGSEQSVARPGGSEITSISFSDAGTVGVVSETGGTRLTRLDRSLSSSGGSIGVGGSVTVVLTGRVHMLPGGGYAIYERSTGAGSWDLVSTSTQTNLFGASPDRIFPLSDSRFAYVRMAVGTMAMDVSPSGAISFGSIVDYGASDFQGGGAVNPERSFVFTGDSGSSSVWSHPVTSAGSYLGQPIQTVLTGAPSAIAYLRNYTRR